jgi:hypothetical protein
MRRGPSRASDAGGAEAGVRVWTITLAISSTDLFEEPTRWDRVRREQRGPAAQSALGLRRTGIAEMAGLVVHSDAGGQHLDLVGGICPLKAGGRWLLRDVRRWTASMRERERWAGYDDDDPRLAS